MREETVVSQKDYKEYFKKEGEATYISTTETPKCGLQPGGVILMMPWVGGRTKISVGSLNSLYV